MIHEASNGKQIAEGIHFRDLTRAERKGKKWKGVFLTDVFYLAETGTRNTYLCKQGGREWGRITPRGILVRQGYAWNYCSGSPDWHKPASGVHDLLYQFSGCTWFPACIDREAADRIFDKFSFGRSSWAFSLGLSAFSWAYWARTPQDGETVEIVHTIEPT